MLGLFGLFLFLFSSALERKLIFWHQDTTHRDWREERNEPWSNQESELRRWHCWRWSLPAVPIRPRAPPRPAHKWRRQPERETWPWPCQPRAFSGMAIGSPLIRASIATRAWMCRCRGREVRQKSLKSWHPATPRPGWESRERCCLRSRRAPTCIRSSPMPMARCSTWSSPKNQNSKVLPTWGDWRSVYRSWPVEKFHWSGLYWSRRGSIPTPISRSSKWEPTLLQSRMPSSKVGSTPTHRPRPTSPPWTRSDWTPVRSPRKACRPYRLRVSSPPRRPRTTSTSSDA